MIIGTLNLKCDNALWGKSQRPSNESLVFFDRSALLKCFCFSIVLTAIHRRPSLEQDIQRFPRVVALLVLFFSSDRSQFCFSSD